MESFGILDNFFGSQTPLVWYFTYNAGGKDISSNPITHLRKIDYICLKSTPELHEIWLWAKSLFSYSDNQVIFYEVPTNKDEESLILKEIFAKFTQNPIKPIFFPFKIDPILNKEAEKAGFKVCSDNIYELPDKRWLYPEVPSETIHVTRTFSKSLPKALNILPGYTCFSRDQLREARNLLLEKNIKKFVIKNVFTSAGKNIYFLDKESEEEFESILQSIKFETLPNRIHDPAYIIEEMLDIELDSHCETRTPIVHCMGTYILPSVLHQIVKGSKYLGTSSQSPDLDISKKCLSQAKLLSESLNLKGPWGIDFVVDKSAIPYPIDINIGRLCGSHYIRFFIDLYAKDQFFEAWKVGSAKAPLGKIQEMLRKEGVEFDFKKKSGVSLIRVGDVGNLTVLVVGEKQEDLKTMREKIIEILEGLIEKS